MDNCCLLNNNGLPSCGGGGNRYQSSSSSFADEAAIIRELNELSVEEREKAMDDLHGVAKVYEETPEFVEEIIRVMDETLGTIPAKTKRDYTRALFLWPGLKNDTKFKLRFLRADSYDARKAATRLVNYYAEKRQLFGEEKLVKDITINDLSEGALREFSSGCTVVLPIKDQTGRPIVFYDELPTTKSHIPIGSTLRAFWYNLMHVYEDETAQLKGGVCINRICITPGATLNPKWIQRQMKMHSNVADLLLALPLRWSSFHVCIDSPSIGILVSSARLALGKFTRLRLRVHIGSDMENEYALMSYGIPCEGVLQKTRKGYTDLHTKFIQRRKEIDRKKVEHESQECVRTGLVQFVTQSDVLFGRGRPYRDFPGNEAWNRVIADHYDRYRLGNSRFEKTCVAMEAVKEARNCPHIRFFLQSSPDGGWKMIRGDAYLREKASMALQNRGKALSRLESRNVGDGSIAKRRRYESNKVFEDDELEDPFEPLPL